MKDQILQSLFVSWAEEQPSDVLALGANGSNRKYWRIISPSRRCIAAYNPDVHENEAFFYYSEALAQRGIHVPKVYAVDDTRCYYLQEDLGDVTLYSYLLDKRRQGVGFDAEAMRLYRQVLDDLAEMQVAGRDLDFSRAYPRSRFDAQSIAWDLQYFKYYFLKLAHTTFDEELLEQDFRTLTDYLLSTDCGFLLYRDFQSRNIMLVGHGDEESGTYTPYYIDFQGARQGAAQYDVASLLYSAKSDLPEPVRQELLGHYVHSLYERLNDLQMLDGGFDSFNSQYTGHFYSYVLIRILQAMGAYGYRGWFERKDYFLQSIPLAVNNLRNLLQDHPVPVQLPHLNKVLLGLVDKQWDEVCGGRPATVSQQSETLTVTVTSFSYKQGLPTDSTGHGGGFVFDCRALPNPGRYPQYRQYTGLDLPVIEFFHGDTAIKDFLCNAQKLVEASIRNYQERHFSNLSVAFGCTGGQHRSVYCAEKMAQWIRENFDCHVIVIHREQRR